MIITIIFETISHTKYQKQHILFYLYILINYVGYLGQNSPKIRIKDYNKKCLNLEI